MYTTPCDKKADFFSISNLCVCVCKEKHVCTTNSQPVKEGICPVQAVVGVIDGESVGPAQLVGTDLGDVGAIHEGTGNVGTLTGIAQPIRVKYLTGMDTQKKKKKKETINIGVLKRHPDDKLITKHMHCIRLD